jgi:hypothetical protein
MLETSEDSFWINAVKQIRMGAFESVMRKLPSLISQMRMPYEK